MSGIADRLNGVLEKISSAAERAGRDSEAVRLVAVSKTRPVGDIIEAHNAGQRAFGENRVQELSAKFAELPGGIEWHLIGHLQRNKAATAVESSSMIHSVDSVKLAKRIDLVASRAGKTQKILIEANVSGEKSKFGAESGDEMLKLGEICLELPNVSLLGLMTMAPFGAPESELHRVFSRLRQVRDRMERELGISLPELSMGMSQDYETAVGEGATIVRVGTAIFGPRQA